MSEKPDYKQIDMHSLKRFGGDTDVGIGLQKLFEMVGEQTQVVDAAIGNLQGQGDTISIADMMEMQVKMNRLAQFSELSTNVIAGAAQALQSVARNVK